MSLRYFIFEDGLEHKSALASSRDEAIGHLIRTELARKVSNRGDIMTGADFERYQAEARAWLEATPCREQFS